MNPQATHPQRNDMTDVLHVAIDLGSRKWSVVSGVPGGRARCQSIEAGDLEGLHEQFEKAKARVKLPPEAPVVSCYEAGRDGFWLHRYLVGKGIENVVIDPASCEVDQRAKRRKTDRLDGEMMLDLLMRHYSGVRSPLRVVTVPTEQIEDERRLPRERGRLVKERTRQTNRIKDILIKFGIQTRMRDLPKRLEDLRGPDGSGIPPHARAQIVREHARLQLIIQQIKEIEEEMCETISSSKEACKKVGTLSSLRSIGFVTAATLYYEFFWRKFNNRREVGSLAGMVSAPWRSDGINREQGITKAGNHRVRTLMVQLAWNWLRFQPESELARWYHKRYGPHSKRSRKAGIVALARRLLIQLWRFTESNVPPAQAQLSL